MRIVNGRRLKGEVFDQLIDPQRVIYDASLRVRGITRKMLSGKPDIARVLPRRADSWSPLAGIKQAPVDS